MHQLLSCRARLAPAVLPTSGTNGQNVRSIVVYIWCVLSFRPASRRWRRERDAPAVTQCLVVSIAAPSTSEHTRRLQRQERARPLATCGALVAVVLAYGAVCQRSTIFFLYISMSSAGMIAVKHRSAMSTRAAYGRRLVC